MLQKTSDAQNTFILNACAADQTFIKYFLCKYRLPRKNCCQCQIIHQAGRIISDLQEDPPEATGGFLAAALILAYRNATDRSQQAVEITHHLPHPDLLWRLHQDITPALPGYALNPALGFQVEHDMLQKALGNIIPLGQLPDGYGALFIMLHQGKHCS